MLSPNFMEYWTDVLYNTDITGVILTDTIGAILQYTKWKYQNLYYYGVTLWGSDICH